MRVRAADLASFPLGPDALLVHARDTGAARVVPPDVAQALAGCSAFASLEAHAAQQARVRGAGAELGPVLADLAGAGFLVGSRRRPAGRRPASTRWRW
jgi:hypothetical protein